MRNPLSRIARANTVERAKVLLHLALPLILTLAGLAVVDLFPATAVALFAAGVLIGLWSEQRMQRRESGRRTLESNQMGYAIRSGLRDLMLLAFAAVAAPSTASFQLVLAGYVLLTCARFAHHILRVTISTTRQRKVGWRNFEVPSVVRTRRLSPALFRELPTLLTYASALVGLVFCGTVIGLSTSWLVAAVPVAAVAAVAAVTANLVDLSRARAETDEEGMVEALAAALADYQPEILFYYSRPEKAGYIANVWMHTLEQLDRKVLVLVREAHNLGQIESETLPMIQVSRAGDIERLLPESVQIALYPSNVATNNHLIRLPGIVDVFVGHGDSDKGGSATTLSRIYDEIWVSGEAAQDRYRIAEVGVRDEQIRQVGRPQLAEISRAAQTSVEEEAADGFDYTVLYAPTREGFYAEWEYSSILTQGEAILTGLMALPGVRVLFKPHPGTGTDNSAYKREVRKLRNLVTEQGEPHEVVKHGQELYQAFNRADLLVSDVSSVITDFLASGKPYVVTNSSGATADAFRTQYPSADGAYILGDDSDLEAIIADARDQDSLRDRREQCASYLLGLTGEEPVARFDHAITDAIDRFAPTYRRAGSAS